MCGAKQRTGIVLLLLLATVGLQAEIENEKTYGTCTVFNHTDNFNDELLIVVRCLPRDRDETVEEELQLFIAGFADNSIVVGVAPVIPTSKQPLEYLVKKLYDTLYYSDGWHSTPQMEWRFDKEESKKSQWLLGYTGVCLQSSSEDGDNKRNFLNSVEKSDRFVIRGTDEYVEGVVFELAQSDKAIEEFKKRLELSSKQRDELNTNTENDRNEAESQ